MLEPAIAEAAKDGSFAFVVTSGQRLAATVRAFQAGLVGQEIGASWSGPSVVTWTQFVRHCYDLLVVDPDRTSQLPNLIQPAVERVYWREVVSETLKDFGSTRRGLGAIARECARTTQRLVEWQVDPSQLSSTSNTTDTDFYLHCSQRMERIVARENGTLECELADVVRDHAKGLMPKLRGRVAFAGFNRLTPQQNALVDAMGVLVLVPESPEKTEPDSVHHFESSADELRAAGAWARERLEHDADARLAIVVPNLSERAEAARRDVLDGLLPHAGFELADPSAHWLNVSLGESLSQVPAVADALHWIRFVVYGGSFDSVSRLNRCGSFPDDALTLERWLRLERDRDWNVASLAKAARSGRVELPTWLAASRDLYDALRDREYPSTWVTTIGERLRQSGWLATSVDDTIRYQLKTQWQESLESLARLDQACDRISLGETLELLDSVLVDRVFSPEQSDAPVLLCGPIETTGLSFDAVWITGLDSVQWPPPGNPLSLVAVRLQREYEMPDASPEQTRAFWSTQWRRIRGASKSLVASYATFVDGRERLASPVIAGGRGTSRIESTDPTAITLLDCLPVKRTPEQFPVWPHGRRASGGHHVLARWAADPFAAQVIGRWNLRPLEQPTKGLSARTRGVLIHRSLETLYASGVSAILEDIDASVADAVASAFRREFVEAESAYRAALRYEERRARELLRAFVELESERTDLEIVALEAPLSLLLAGIDFQLRADRIDRLPTGDLIMDYKTGTRDADAAITRGDFDRITQLAVYALAADVAPAAVCLATLHPKHIGFRGIYADEVTRLPGDRSKPVNSLNTLIPLWRTEATRRAGALAAGQAWLNLASPASEWLPYGVISRIADVRKHGE